MEGSDRCVSGSYVGDRGGGVGAFCGEDDLVTGGGDGVVVGGGLGILVEGRVGILVVGGVGILD